MKVQEIILPSGEAVSREDILRAFRLLAEAEASFPMLEERDMHLACLLMFPEVLEQAAQDAADHDERDASDRK